MKKILSLALCLILGLSVLASCSSSSGGDKVTLNVYNWGEYIDPTALDIFEKETGIIVNYQTFAQNEEMYAKIKSGGASYDVVIPSDYMIGRMIEENMLEKLDLTNIPNSKFIADNYKNTAYDPQNEYSIPYTAGTVVLIYNTKMVDKAPDSWDILWDEKYKGQILMFDNSRDAIGIALKKLGFSYNTTDETQIKAAVEELKKQKPLVQAYVMDQIFDKMGNNEAALSAYYAGDAVVMMEENPDLAFAIPKEGTNLFIDAMCIPKGSAHKKEAEEFINFMCRTDIAVLNAEEICYTTPSTAALEELDPELKENTLIYPPDNTYKNTETFANLPQATRELYDKLWFEVYSK